MKLGVLFCLLILMSASLAPEGALACSCIPSTLESRYERAPNVFTAIVTSQYSEPTDRRSSLRTLISITEVFKGQPTFGVLISNPDGNTCGITPQVGTEYLFFAGESGEIGGCSGNRQLSGADLHLDTLRAYSSEEISQIGEPWDFRSNESNCSLWTRFDYQIESDRNQVASLGFRHGWGNNQSEELPELEVRGIIAFDFKPEGSHNPMKITVGDDVYLASWITGQKRDQELADGTRRTISHAQAFRIHGAQVLEILERLNSVDSIHISFDAEHSDLDIDAFAHISHFGTGIADMLACAYARQ